MRPPWIFFADDSMSHPSLNFQWWYLVLQWPRFRRRLLHQQWHSVFDDSMRQPWLYFGNRCHASVENSLTLSLQYGSWHSVFIDDFNVYKDSVFADDLWISSDKVFLTIPCISDDSIFAIDLMYRSWIHWRCRFHTSAVTQFSVRSNRFRVTQFSLTIFGQQWRSFH